MQPFLAGFWPYQNLALFSTLFIRPSDFWAFVIPIRQIKKIYEDVFVRPNLIKKQYSEKHIRLKSRIIMVKSPKGLEAN